jgi:FKBP-type peptidyl-prolyl cis-trans isomerase
MQEGAHWDVVVPPQLAYQGSKHGAIARAAAVPCCSSVPLHRHVCCLTPSAAACDNGVTIPPWSVLKFDIELVQVNNNA